MNGLPSTLLQDILTAYIAFPFNRKTNFAQTVYSDVTTTLVIFNKMCIATGIINVKTNSDSWWPDVL